MQPLPGHRWSVVNTVTAVRPFPVAPDFAATGYDREVYRLQMREAWLDRADAWLTESREAAGAGNYVHAEARLADVQRALAQAKLYAPQVTP